MATSLPYTFAGTLSYTPYEGAPALDIAFDVAGTYVSKVDERYALTGAGTTPINFGTLPAAGVKAFLVIYEAGTAPITVAVSGGAEEELAPGGARLYLDPVPSSGVTGAAITTTADATVRVIILG